MKRTNIAGQAINCQQERPAQGHALHLGYPLLDQGVVTLRTDDTTQSYARSVITTTIMLLLSPRSRENNVPLLALNVRLQTWQMYRPSLSTSFYNRR